MVRIVWGEAPATARRRSELATLREGRRVTLTAEPLRVTPASRLRPGWVGRSTPARLRTVSIGLVVLTLLAGLLGGLAASQRQGATSSAWQNAEPLMVTAQAIDTSLSDADTTAAASFLQGRLQPAGLERRYQNDLTDASAYVAAASREAGADPSVSASLRTLSTELPAYAGIVQEANANEQQSYYPLAAAYLAEASNLMRTSMLPAAAQLYGTEANRLTSEQDSAVSPWLAALAILALIALVVSLVLAQRWLRHQFHRTWNVALAAATVAVVVLGVWATVAFITQNSDVNGARANGSKPVSAFTDARILALRARADDELTLLTRDVDPSYQRDYTRTYAALHGLLARSASSSDNGSFAHGQAVHAQSALAAYELVHHQIRVDDAALGNVPSAVGLATQQLPAASSRLDGVLSDGIGNSQATFVNSTSGAASDLDGLVWALAIGAILVAVLVLVGIQPRIEEYR